MQSKADHFPPQVALLAEAFRALGHPARLEILRTLAAREACICGDLVEVLPLAQATVSQHLKALKSAGLVKGEVDGPRVCYCLDAEAVASLREAAAAFFSALEPAPSSCC